MTYDTRLTYLYSIIATSNIEFHFVNQTAFSNSNAIIGADDILAKLSTPMVYDLEATPEMLQKEMDQLMGGNIQGVVAIHNTTDTTAKTHIYLLDICATITLRISLKMESFHNRTFVYNANATTEPTIIQSNDGTSKRTMR